MGNSNTRWLQRLLERGFQVSPFNLKREKKTVHTQKTSVMVSCVCEQSKTQLNNSNDLVVQTGAELHYQ